MQPTSNSGYSFQERTGDGSNTVFTFAFIGLGRGYISRDDIYVFYRQVIDGKNVWKDVTSNVVQFPTELSVELNFAPEVPTDGVPNILIRRIQDSTKPFAEWESDSIYQKTVLNYSFLHDLYICHQLLDGFVENEVTRADLDMRMFRITNLADAIDDHDAINKGQVERLLADASGDIAVLVQQAIDAALAAEASETACQQILDTLLPISSEVEANAIKAEEAAKRAEEAAASVIHIDGLSKTWDFEWDKVEPTGGVVLPYSPAQVSLSIRPSDPEAGFVVSKVTFDSGSRVLYITDHVALKAQYPNGIFTVLMNFVDYDVPMESMGDTAAADIPSSAVAGQFWTITTGGSITGIYGTINSITNDIIVWKTEATRAGWLLLGNFTGEQGIQGIQGIQGVKGDKGEAGTFDVKGNDTLVNILAKTPVNGDLWISTTAGSMPDGTPVPIGGGLLGSDTEWTFIGKLQGIDGKDGADGKDGTDGTNGTDGADGADGKGWTSGTYDAATGIVTFASTDGLGFTTTDLRGKDGKDGLALVYVESITDGGGLDTFALPAGWSATYVTKANTFVEVGGVPQHSSYSLVSGNVKFNTTIDIGLSVVIKALKEL